MTIKHYTYFDYVLSHYLIVNNWLVNLENVSTSNTIFAYEQNSHNGGCFFRMKLKLYYRKVQVPQLLWFSSVLLVADNKQFCWNFTFIFARIYWISED